MSYDFSLLTIMLVEDNAHMRKLVREILSGFNIRNVRSFATAEDAIKGMTSDSFDLAFIDLHLEEASGLDLTRWIRNSKHSADRFLPVIMITGHSERNRVEEARDAGINEFLVKPISGQAIYDKLSQTIENPRSYINLDGYFGPDRRRRHNPEQAKACRRKDDVGEKMSEEKVEKKDEQKKDEQKQSPSTDVKSDNIMFNKTDKKE